jgi:spartin
MSEQNPYSNLQQNVNDAFNELEADESVYVPQREAEELFNLPDSVHIFFIAATGQVSTFSEPTTLRIFRFKDTSEGETKTFIQVGGWTHPLIPGASPVLEAGNGAFMFPDVYGDDGSCVGLVLADDSPFNIDGEAQSQLANILDELTALKKEEPAVNEQNLGKIGSALLKGAQVVGKGMEMGAEKATHLIEYVSEKQKAKIQDRSPDEDVKVNKAIVTSVKGAKYATNATVKVSGFVSKRVGKLSKGLAKHLAKKMEPTVTGATGGIGGGKSSTTKSSSMHNIVDAARGGLLAYGTVYASLEESAKVLGKSVKEESVQVVEKKYGKQSGEVLEDGLTSAGNATMTYMNIQSLGVKGLVKKTAKDTGKQLGKAVLEAHATGGNNEKKD